MSKARIDILLEPAIYYKLLEYQSKNKHENLSRATSEILKNFFMSLGEQSVAIDRLTKVIQGYEVKIRDMQHDIIHDADKKVADIKKAEILRPK